MLECFVQGKSLVRPSLRNERCYPAGASSAVRLQKRVELGARKDGLRLLQSLDFLVAGGLPIVKVLKHEVACTMQLGLGSREVLQFGLGLLQRRLRLGQLSLGLCFLLGLVVYGLARRNDRRVRLLHEVL